MESNFISGRLSHLYPLMNEAGCDILFLTSRLSSKYFADFHGSSSFIIVTKDYIYIISDGRYKNEISNLDSRFTPAVYSENIFEFIKNENLFKGKKIGIEGDDINFNSYMQLKKFYPAKVFVNVSTFLSPVVATHDEESIRRIKQSIKISKRVYKEISDSLKEGQSEIDISAEISYKTKKYGADGDAFSPIVLFGEKSALPHGKPSNRKLKKNDVVLIDIGCSVKGVCCDFTRTFVFGKMNEEQKKVFTVVKRAKNIGIENAINKNSCKNIDMAVRKIIEENNLGNYFVHATGHGLGYDVHLYPRISSASQQVIKNNFIITIEPGVYIPGSFGVRFEDDILIKNNSPINLTKFN